jgi:hypothetical protein
MSLRRARIAAWALVVAQVQHGIVPSETSEHSIVGPIAGVLLLGWSVAAVVGLQRSRPSAYKILGWTGFSVALGFVLYHASPWHSAFTRPYFGESVGVPAWISVGIAIAAGIWAAIVGLGGARNDRDSYRSRTV